MSADPLQGLGAGLPRPASADGAAASRPASGPDAVAARRAARTVRDFQALFVMEMLKPLTEELANAGSMDGEDGGLGLSSGSDVYSYFWSEGLAQHLASALPGLPGLEAIEAARSGNTGGAAGGAAGAAGAAAGAGAGAAAGAATGGVIGGAARPGAVGAIRMKRPTLAEFARALTAPASPDATTTRAATSGAASAADRAVAGLSGEVSELAAKAGRLFSLPENLVRAVVSVESGGRTGAVSGKGATGLMQLMPGTAREMGVKDPTDAWDNLVGGAKYLARQLERFGRLDHALAAYNAGPGAVEKHGGVPPSPETRDYVRRVMAAKTRLDRTNPAGA